MQIIINLLNNAILSAVSYVSVTSKQITSQLCGQPAHYNTHSDHIPLS
jgi:hypothetical protein